MTVPAARPSHPWVTLLTDYGNDDSFVGLCKGVIARIAPSVRIIDICHQIAPQDLEQGAVTLASAVAYLPVGVHLALIDPVAALAARPVVVLTADGNCFLSPDNGLASWAWEKAGGVKHAYEVSNSDLFLPVPSRLFRGRDIFAPVAGRLAAGLDPAEVGPELDPANLTLLPRREGYVHGDHVHADVVAVDHFGNLALNISRSDLEAAGLMLGDDVELRAAGRSVHVPFASHYGEVAKGRLAVCEDPFRRVMVAVNLGNAAATLRTARGEPVVIAQLARAATTPARAIGVLDPPVG